VAKGTGLPGAVVQRSLADWPVVAAAWLLLVCATTLLATGVVYGDAVAAGGLHRALLSAPPATRALDVSLSSEPGAIETLDAGIRPEMARATAATGGDVVRIARSGSFADAATAAADVHDLTTFASVEGLENRVRLVEGAWPTAGGEPLQATVSDAGARALNVRVGGRLDLVSRLDPTRRVSVVVAGIWSVDVDDALWLGDELDTTGTTNGGTFTTRGPLFVREADIVALGGGPTRLQLEWRGLPDIPNLRVEGVDDLRNGANDLAARLRGVVPAQTSPRVTTTLPALLDDVGRSVLVSRSGVILLTIQFAILAGYAVVLVAGMLVERRRSEIALMRSRGASAAHLVAMAVLEAAILAIPAAALAPFLALGVVAILGAVGPTAGLGLLDTASIGQSAILVSALAGLACIVALTLPTLSVSASPAGARAATGRQLRTTLAQRLGLDLALVAVAAVALWQLRLYGAPLTRNARGTLGLDPLLVAAPAIGLVGGAVLALRVVPRVAELGEGLLVRGRGLVGSLGGRQLARRPLRYTRAALLLMLAAALGTLGAAHAATWTRSQVDQADYQAVADVRTTQSDYATIPTWAVGSRYRGIDGVTAATPVDTAPVNVGRTIRDGTLLAFDPATAGALIGGGTSRPDRAALIDALGSKRLAIPVVALPGLPTRIALTVDAAFKADPEVGTGTITPGSGGLGVSAVIRDGDGRLFRTSTAEGELSGAAQRLVLSLVDAGDATRSAGAASLDPALRPAGPLALEGITVLVHPSGELVIRGEATITAVEATDAPAGDAGWSPVTVNGAAPGWSWRQDDADRSVSYRPPDGQPLTIAIGERDAVFGGAGAPGRTFRLAAGPGPDERIPAIVSESFLAKAGADVGDELDLSSLGQQIPITIVGRATLFAPLDPNVPFALVDLATFDTLRDLADGSTRGATEWWLTTRPGSEAGVVAALRARDAGTSRVIGREELGHDLASDPVPLGLIGVLGLGSIAAMLFAGIGFLVSSTISTSERIGEFALLRALGLSTRQLRLWLSIESVFLLVVGLVAGSLLGLLLAWLVLPFATLTQTGAAPIPAPIVEIPWTALAPPYVAAAVLFVLSLWIVQRQLPDVRISGVLRARES
jgi:hypothetical protein